MTPPITYYGGKVRLARWIVDVMRRYAFKRYVEPFGGGAAVLFAKPPSACEVYNDLFSDVVNLYKVLRDPHQCEQLIQLLAFTPYARAIYNDSCRALENEETTEVRRAWAFFICIRQSFSNLMNSWATPSECSRTVASITYSRAIDRLPEVHKRLQNVHLEHKDAIECIKQYVNANSLMYLDPPYLHATRVSTNDYRHEYTDEQHEQLVKTLLEVPGHKILSGYESPIYQPLLDAGWELLKTRVCCHASGRSEKSYRVECLYCSPIKEKYKFIPLPFSDF